MVSRNTIKETIQEFSLVVIELSRTRSGCAKRRKWEGAGGVKICDQVSYISISFGIASNSQTGRPGITGPKETVRAVIRLPRFVAFSLARKVSSWIFSCAEDCSHLVLISVCGGTVV
jgi:hypothetical protein